MSDNLHNVPAELLGNPVMLMRIEDLELPNRKLFWALKSYLGIIYVAQVFEKRLSDFIKIPALGNKTLNDFKTLLRAEYNVPDSILNGRYNPVPAIISKMIFKDEPIPQIQHGMTQPSDLTRNIESVLANHGVDIENKIRDMFQINAPSAVVKASVAPLTVSSVGIQTDRISAEFNLPPMIAAALAEGHVDDQVLQDAFSKALGAVGEAVTVELQADIVAALDRS